MRMMSEVVAIDDHPSAHGPVRRGTSAASGSEPRPRCPRWMRRPSVTYALPVAGVDRRHATVDADEPTVDRLDDRRVARDALDTGAPCLPRVPRHGYDFPGDDLSYPDRVGGPAGRTLRLPRRPAADCRSVRGASRPSPGPGPSAGQVKRRGGLEKRALPSPGATGDEKVPDNSTGGGAEGAGSPRRRRDGVAGPLRRPGVRNRDRGVVTGRWWRPAAPRG